MNILITGGTGFIGEHFVPELLKEGHNIRLLVRNVNKAQKVFGNKCNYFVGDVTNKNSLIGCCDNIDIVYHMVAKVGNQLPSEENFTLFRRTNVEGTKNMIGESKNADVKKFIFVSSIAAIGIVHENPITEKSKCSPYLPYQVSKYEAEQLVRKEYEENRFPGIIIRPTKVYGVGEHEYSYLTLAKLCKKGLFLKVGKKKNYTSNIYVTDLVQGLVQLVDHGKMGSTYILTSDDSISFIECGKVIADVIGKKIRIIPISKNLMIGLASIQEKLFLAIKKKPIVTRRNIEATVNDRVYDISKAKNDLGFAPVVSMKEGIIKTVEWYIEQGLV